MTKDQSKLLKWYDENKRDLPWRGSREAYAIWLSEVMLQQTTVTAVIPYYQRFIKKFPTIMSLANAKESEVLEYWAGLGYYSRARMLHRTAQEIATKEFPKTHDELLKLHGFGPYTARAVASLAFGESVGAVDGNVIRVLSRRFGIRTQWWTPKGRLPIQVQADKLVQNVNSSDVNQALMDLGSMVCTAKNPHCFICPWMKDCVAYQSGSTALYPGPKPRRAREIWIWKPSIFKKGKKILFIENNYAPFLKGQWLPPGRALQKLKPPKKYLFRHSITHHDIFVVATQSAATQVIAGLAKEKSSLANVNVYVDIGKSTFSESKHKYITAEKIVEVNPTSLIRKLMEHT